MSLFHAVYVVGAMLLFSIGLYGILAKRHILKIFMGIAMMEISVYLLLIALSFSLGETAPILSDGLKEFRGMSDPVPQALTLTAIVIGMAVMALGVSFAINYHKLTKRCDVNELKELGE